jgi:hypothetical protein
MRDSKEFLKEMLRLIRPRLTKDDSLMEKFLNDEAIDRDAFMLRMCFGAIEQHVELMMELRDGQSSWVRLDLYQKSRLETFIFFFFWKEITKFLRLTRW